MTLSWIAVEAATGRLICDLKGLDVKDLPATIGRSEATTAALPLTDDLHPDWARAVVPGYACMVALDDGEPVWAGLVLESPQTDADVMTLSLMTLEEYLDRRYVGSVSYTGIGRARMVENLVLRYATGGSVPGIPVDVQVLSDGVVDSASWDESSSKTVLDAIDELAAREGGIEWTVRWRRVVDASGTRYLPRVVVGAQLGDVSPAPGVTLSTRLAVKEFDRPRSYRRGSGANRIKAASSGQGGARPMTGWAVAPEDDGRPAFDEVYSPATDIADTRTLGGHARERLAQVASGSRGLTLEVRTSGAGVPVPGVDYRLGDAVGYDLKGRSLGYDPVTGAVGSLRGVARVAGWVLHPQAETATITLDVPSGVVEARDNPRLSTINLHSGSLPHWRRALALAAGGQVRAHVTCLLDSITAGAGCGYPEKVNGWPGRLGALLAERMPVVDSGWMPVHDPGAIDDRMIIGSPDWAAVWGIFGLGALRLSGVGARLELAPMECDTVEILALRTSGTGHVRIDGPGAGEAQFYMEPAEPAVPGIWPASSTAHPDLVRVVVQITPGVHTVIIEPHSVGAEVFPVAVRAHVAGSSGVTVSNLARGGAAMIQVVQDSSTGYTGMPISIDAMHADLLILMPGMNDYQAHHSTSVFSSMVRTVILRQRASGGDVLLVAPPQPDYTHIPADGVTSPPLSDYRAQVLALASELDVPVVDIHTRWGQWSQWAANGWNSDFVHLSAAGAREAASVILGALDSL